MPPCPPTRSRSPAGSARSTVAKTWRRRSLVLVEDRQELRIEVPEHRSGQRHRDFRVRVRRSRAHEEAVGYPHRRIVTGPRSPAPTRRGSPAASGRLPAWNGCSSPRGRCRPSLPTSPRIPAPTQPGCPVARTDAAPATGPQATDLRLVMVVTDAEAAAVRPHPREHAPPDEAALVAHRRATEGRLRRDPDAGARRHRPSGPAAGAGSSGAGGSGSVRDLLRAGIDADQGPPRP